MSDPKDRFSCLMQESDKFNEKNDCVVKMISVVCGIEYADAHALAKKFGRKNNDGMRFHDYSAAIKSLGFKLESIDESHFISRYPSWYQPKNLTTYQQKMFPKVWKDGQMYIARVPGHVLAIDNGQVIDWTHERKFRITRIYRVTKNE